LFPQIKRPNAATRSRLSGRPPRFRSTRWSPPRMRSASRPKTGNGGCRADQTSSVFPRGLARCWRRWRRCGGGVVRTGSDL